MKNYFAIALLVLNMSGCGTDTGNPSLTDVRLPRGSNPLIGNQLDSFLCDKLTTCGFSTESDCPQKVSSLTSIPEELALDPEVYKDYAAIQAALTTKNLVSVPDEEVRCFLTIDRLDCNDSLTRAALVPDFSGVHLLLRSSLSCQKMIQTLNGPTGH